MYNKNNAPCKRIFIETKAPLNGPLPYETEFLFICILYFILLYCITIYRRRLSINALSRRSETVFEGRFDII
jgi:hypothetical protein